MSEQRKKHGRLGVGVSDRGRKIDTWTFRGSDAIGGNTHGIKAHPIVFEVTLLHSLAFSVDTKDIPPQRWTPLSGLNLANLHSQAQDLSRAEFDLRQDLTWTDWLEIRIQEMPPHDRRDIVSGGQASVSYAQIARAEKPDGTAYTINGNGLLVDFPTSVGVCRDTNERMGGRRIPLPSIQPEASPPPANSASCLSAAINSHDRRPAETQFVYLPDTQENRIGLEAIVVAIEKINQRLQAFLGPDQIQQTLARARGADLHLLTGPTATLADPPTPDRKLDERSRRGPV